LPVLLFGLLFLLPLEVGMLPSWLAGRPPLVVVPEAAEAPAVGFAAEFWLCPDVLLPGAVVPPVEGAPDASGAGTPPLKPLLPPAGLSPAEGVRDPSAPVAAAGAEPDPVLPGVLPGPPASSLPQALKPSAKAKAITARPGPCVEHLENGRTGMVSFLRSVAISGLSGASISQRRLGHGLLSRRSVCKSPLTVLRLCLRVAPFALMVVAVIVGVHRRMRL
jgi:hypothetical protein